MAYINIDDIVIHYEIYGQGAPLLLLHGNGEDMSYFVHQIPLFALEYKVICFDTRGHGASTRGVKPMSFSTLCDDVFMFMEAIGVLRAHVLGFSDGANIALMLAIQHPKKIAGLILNSPNINPSGLLPILRFQMQIKHDILSLLPMKKAKKEKELLELMLKEPSIDIEKLTALDLNILLIAGEKDMIRYQHTKMIAAALPHCVLKIIPDADHFVAAKKSELFNQEVMKFLSGFPSYN